MLCGESSNLAARMALPRGFHAGSPRRFFMDFMITQKDTRRKYGGNTGGAGSGRKGYGVRGTEYGVRERIEKICNKGGETGFVFLSEKKLKLTRL
jgi:hypothetical protein